jgi:hypothetical protein
LRNRLNLKIFQNKGKLQDVGYVIATSTLRKAV